MNNHYTINELVGEAKQNLNTLEKVIDTLLLDYRVASERINTAQDIRQGPLTLLQELNDDLNGLVANYFSLDSESVSRNAAELLASIAYSEHTSAE